MYYRTYPKININLEVYPREKNELLHKIKSVVIPFYGLSDLIKFRKSKSYNLKSNIKIEHNILSKIIIYFEKNFNIKFKYQIILKKRIPLSSGLGGASSNAWCLISFINNTYKLNLSNQELINIALLFGSDIPLFSYQGSVLVSNYGDEVSLFEIKNLDNILLICFKNLAINTKEMYQLLDSELTNNLKNSEYNSDIYSLLEIANSFLKINLKNEYFAKIYNKLNSITNTYLSGSGPSLFMVNIDKKILKQVKKIKDIKSFYYENK